MRWVLVRSSLLLVGAALLGSAIGSFLNVCIARLPKDESIVRPRSKCPKCGTQIKSYDNIPIVSWILLGGKCRTCGERISVGYPLVELSVAVIFALSLWFYGLTLDAAAAAVFGTLLLGIGVTDAREYIIPDEFTWGGLVIGIALSLRAGVDGLVTAITGAVVGFVILYFVAWAGEKAFKKEAMGGGDIKMMAMVGSFVGWQGVLMTLFGGALIGTLVFGPLALRKKDILVPFGVFLAAAAAVVFVIGDGLLRWYLDLLMGGAGAP